MENQDYTPVEERSYSRIFFWVSMLLVVVTLWAVGDEVYLRRPWKKYQQEFYALEYQKTEQEYEAKKAAVAAEQQKLQTDLTRAKAALAANPAYQEAQQHLSAAKLRLAEVTQEQRFAKSRLDEAYYWYEKAIEERAAEEIIQPLAARVKEREAEVEQYTPEIDQLTQQKNTWEQKVVELEKPSKDLENKLFTLTAEVKRIAGRLQGLATDYGLFRVYTPPEIKQVVLTGLDKSSFNEPLMRIDRCMTCHMGIDRADFVDAPQPFTTHPHRDEILGKHPVEKFGCSICHLGQGVALEIEEAHGEVELIERTQFLNEPMLKGEWIQASCRQCHEEAFKLEKFAPLLVQGVDMFRSWGCAGCHIADGLKIEPLPQLDKVGPSLVHLGSKVHPSWLVRWIQNPKDYLPNTKMPNFLFSEKESEAVSAYLLASSTTFSLPASVEPGDPAQGKTVFESIGCQGCHAIDGQGGSFGPDLSRVGSKVHAAWLFAWIKEPHRYNPHTKMPHVPLSDTQIRDLVAYLSRLGTPEEKPELAEKLRNPALIATGKELIEKYGCFGCHDIVGMEKLSRVGAELSTFADKSLVQMLFGYAHVVRPPAPVLPPFDEMAALYGNGQQVLHTWEGWAYGKMKNARLYSTERILSQMPNFAFSDEQAKIMTILLRTLTEQRRNPPFLDQLTPPESITYEGQKLVASYNCLGCHAIKGEGGNIAPQLTYEGSRVKAEWLTAFLQNPVLIRPHLQARMPNFQFTDAQVQTLVNYMMTELRDARTPVGYMAKQDITEATIAEGRKLFWETYPCYTCHRIGDQGGVIGPDLTHIASRLDPDWMFAWIKHPQEWEPATIMPNLGLSEESVRAIVAYLESQPVQAREIKAATEGKTAAASTAPSAPVQTSTAGKTATQQTPQPASGATTGTAEATPSPTTMAKAEPAQQQGDVNQGKTLYQSFCVPCHGPTGQGDGAAAAGLDPKPRNFADKAYMSQKTDDQLFLVIKEGGAAAGLSPAMPPWGAALQDDQIRDVIAFVRTLGGE